MRRSLLIVVAAALLVVGACSKGSGSPSGTPATWGVGSCIYLSQDFNPLPSATYIDPQLQKQIDAQKRYDVISCDDPKALGKITALGATGGDVTSSGCPDDTDLAVQITNDLLPKTDGQIYCTRNLSAPHPGDPGGGGGGLVAGDCVWVTSSQSAQWLNDQIAETECGDGAFASLLALTTDAAQCPAATISRIPLDDGSGTILCLGAGDGTLILRPGDCIGDESVNGYYYPGMRTDCDPNDPLDRILVAFSADQGGCPQGTNARRSSGYDQYLCIRYNE